MTLQTHPACCFYSNWAWSRAWSRAWNKKGSSVEIYRNGAPASPYNFPSTSLRLPSASLKIISFPARVPAHSKINIIRCIAPTVSIVQAEHSGLCRRVPRKTLEGKNKMGTRTTRLFFSAHCVSFLLIRLFT